ncbi:hypothetical protein BH10ACT3_BH10ACT3_12220 [soil metagenome]
MHIERGWEVEQVTGTAQELHDAPVSFYRRSVGVQHVSRPALVLGSTQPIESVDVDGATARGLDVARRHSGGGAVLLSPGSHVWVDLLLPAGDDLWLDDVARSSWWLGAAWADTVLALSPTLPVAATVHHLGLDDRELGRIACFAATGPGEVLIGERKVVGISQRRTRVGARFQCVAYVKWAPAELSTLLHAGARADALTQALEERAGAIAVPSDVALADAPWGVVEELLRHLP